TSKPQNIFPDAQRSSEACDFGVAKIRLHAATAPALPSHTRLFRLAFQEVARLFSTGIASLARSEEAGQRPETFVSFVEAGRGQPRLPPTPAPLSLAPPSQKELGGAEAAAMNPPRWPQPADATRSSVWPRCCFAFTFTVASRREAEITAAYHAALDNLAKEAQHRPRQSPQPQQQQLHPGVAVPSSSAVSFFRHHRPPPTTQSERAQRLLEDYWKRKRLAARIKAQGLGLGGRAGPRQQLSQWEETYPPPPRGGPRASQPTRANSSSARCSTGASRGANGGGGGITESCAEIGRQQQQQRGSDRADGAATEMIRKAAEEEKAKRSRMPILRYINSQGREPWAVTAARHTDAGSGVRRPWDSVDSDVDRLDRLPPTSAGVDFVSGLSAPILLHRTRRRRRRRAVRAQTPRAWRRARADDDGIVCVDWQRTNSVRHPGRSRQAAASKSRWRGRSRMAKRTVKASSRLRHFKTCRQSFETAEGVGSSLQRLPRLLPKLKHGARWVELNTPHSRAGRVSPSIRTPARSTGHSLLDQVALRTDAGAPQKESQRANVRLTTKNRGKSGGNRRQRRGGLEAHGYAAGHLPSSLKNFAIVGCHYGSGALNAKWKPADAAAYLSSLSERQLPSRLKRIPEPRPRTQKTMTPKAEADDAQCSRTPEAEPCLRQIRAARNRFAGALTCSLPDMVDGAERWCIRQSSGFQQREPLQRQRLPMTNDGCVGWLCQRRGRPADEAFAQLRMSSGEAALRGEAEPADDAGRRRRRRTTSTGTNDEGAADGDRRRMKSVAKEGGAAACRSLEQEVGLDRLLEA
uniref:ANK_REP_REGION domain-containing protein n=1 Tax=Macrostomum lignano TaxID=282301 RepID=A0A1I8FDF0_9PLAT